MSWTLIGCAVINAQIGGDDLIQNKHERFGRALCQGLAVLAVLCFGLLLASGIHASELLDDPGALQEFMDQRMLEHMEEHRIPGAVVAVVKDGELALLSGYGYADAERSVPVDPERTLFRPGSVSKLFTWLAVLQLVEAGELDLDADINGYLDFQIPSTLKSGSSAPPITLRHLMTHTPGFEDVLDGLFVLDSDRMMPLAAAIKEFLPARIWAPGELLAYSNYGTALAGYVVERVSGQPFAQYVAEHIYQPLGMDASSFQQPLSAALVDDLAQAGKFVDGQYHMGTFEYIPLAPAGAMSTTASDMAVFMQMHLQQGQYNDVQILSSEMMQKMHDLQYTQHPNVNGVTLGMFTSSINDRAVVAHNGATMLYFTHLYLVPGEQLGFFISASGGEVGAVLEMQRELFHALMDEAYPAARQTVPRQTSGAGQRMQAFLGEYHPTRMNFSGPEKFLGLLSTIQVQRGDDDHLVIRAGAETHSFVEVEPGQYLNTRINERPSIQRAAFVPGPDGQRLLSIGEANFLQAPWYGTLTLLGLLTAAALGLLFLTMMGWLIAAIVRRRRRRFFRSRPGPVGQGMARWTAVLFFLAACGFFVGMVLIFSDIDPAYGVPNMVFGIVPAYMGVVGTLPLVLLGLGGLMVVFTLAAWRGRYWNWLGRLHYSLLTLSVLGLLWVLWFTNQIPL